MTNTDFDGKRALVTGAASGIGLASTKLLCERGAAVLAADRDTARLADAAVLGAETFACDLSDEEERVRLVEAADDCDLLVNSAGIIRLRPISEFVDDDWDTIFSINAKATFFLCQQLGARMPNGGAIVNISSMSARNAMNTETAIYAATKAAVLSITRSFAHAYASREVRVNAIVPGLIDTPMQQKVVADISSARHIDADQLGAERAAAVPIGRLGTPLECAEAVSWLLSPASGYLTGQAIAVDGGATML